ncbi:MAG: hypothetical protein ACE5QW_06680, partial [Thermoplasmata archaeon]
IACWDLNQNGVPDLPAEDLNGDGIVDVNDCTGPQGPAGPGAVMSTVMLVSPSGVAMSGCTNYYSIDITVPGPGTVVLYSFMHFWIEHTSGTTDGWAFGHRLDPADCSLGFADPWMYMDDISSDAPTDLLVNRAGTILNVFTVASAGTYTYYLNAIMWTGESASDEIVNAETVAVFYPS